MAAHVHPPALLPDCAVQGKARAAEVCHVSQPTLSAGIQHLEEELGVAIVKRAQRFEGFTAEEERVLARAQHIQANWDGLKQDVRGMCGDPTGELRCGAIPTTLPNVSLLTGPCRTRYPGITHCVLSLSAVEIIRQIEAFDLDVGITYLEHPKHDQLLELPLYHERYVFITHDQPCFASRQAITWSEAGEIPLCLLTPNMQNRRIIDTAATECGRDPHDALPFPSDRAAHAHAGPQLTPRECVQNPHSTDRSTSRSFSTIRTYAITDNQESIYLHRTTSLET